MHRLVLGATLSMCLAAVPAQSQSNRPFTFEIRVDSGSAAVAKLQAYTRVVELGTGESLVGTDVFTRFDDAKALVTSGRGFVSALDVQPRGSGNFAVAATWSNGTLDKNPRALRLLLDAMGNPSVMVVLSETNMNREVLRPTSDAQMKTALIGIGFRTQAAPRSYLQHLEELKKQFEFRRGGTLNVDSSSFGRVTTVQATEEYVIAWREFLRGGGDDEAVLKAAKSVNATYVLTGDCYTLEVPIPPAAKAYAEQGYRQARAFLSAQAMSVGSQALAGSRADQASGMDFTAETAGNKAISQVAERLALTLARDIAQNIQSRDLGLK
jgi:hypothetical protein